MRNLDATFSSDAGRYVTHHYGPNLWFTVEGFNEPSPTSSWGGLLKYEYMVAAYPLSPSLPSYWAVTRTMVGQLLTVPTPLMGDATRYIVFVRAYNKAGLSCNWTAGGDVVIDRSPPVFIGSIIDGGYHGDPKHNLTVSWKGAFFDAESDILRYEVFWGTTAGASDVSPVPLGFPASSGIVVASWPFVDRWDPKRTYYASVRAFNRAGGNTTRTARGQRMDLSPPTNVAFAPAVERYAFNPAPSGTRQYTRADSLSVRYTYLEPESDFLGVHLYVGAAKESTELHNSTYMSTGSESLYARGVTVSLNASQVTHNQLIWACIRVKSAALKWAEPVCTPLRIVKSPPLLYEIRHRPSAAPASYPATISLRGSSSETLAVAWDACVGTGVSAIDHYEVSILSNRDTVTGKWSPFLPGPDTGLARGDIVMPWLELDKAKRSFNYTLPFTVSKPGTSVYVALRCVDTAGLVTTIYTEALVRDTTPPVARHQSFGHIATGMRRWQPSGTVLSFSWIVEDSESLLWGNNSVPAVWAGTRWAYGVMTFGACDIRSAWQQLTRANNFGPVEGSPFLTLIRATWTGPLQLATNTPYCLRLTMVNHALLEASHTLENWRVDVTPPVLLSLPGGIFAVVRDGPNASHWQDLDWASGGTVYASWFDSFADPEVRGVNGCMCAQFSLSGRTGW